MLDAGGMQIVPVKRPGEGVVLVLRRINAYPFWCRIEVATPLAKEGTIENHMCFLCASNWILHTQRVRGVL